MVVSPLSNHFLRILLGVSHLPLSESHEPITTWNALQPSMSDGNGSWSWPRFSKEVQLLAWYCRSHWRYGLPDAASNSREESRSCWRDEVYWAWRLGVKCWIRRLLNRSTKPEVGRRSWNHGGQLHREIKLCTIVSCDRRNAAKLPIRYRGDCVRAKGRNCCVP